MENDSAINKDKNNKWKY